MAFTDVGTQFKSEPHLILQERRAEMEEHFSRAARIRTRKLGFARNYNTQVAALRAAWRLTEYRTSSPRLGSRPQVAAKTGLRRSSSSKFLASAMLSSECSEQIRGIAR
jgi:hypothetical protein